MTDKYTPPPPAEQSLKYLAWSIKEMNENVKRIADFLENSSGTLNSSVPKSSVFPPKSTRSYKDDTEIPF